MAGYIHTSDRMRKMVSFELGKEIVKHIFCLVTRGTKKKFSDLADRRVTVVQ